LCALYMKQRSGGGSEMVPGRWVVVSAAVYGIRRRWRALCKESAWTVDLTGKGGRATDRWRILSIDSVCRVGKCGEGSENQNTRREGGIS